MQVLEFTDLELKSEIQKVLKHGYTFYHEQNLTQSQLVNYAFRERVKGTDLKENQLRKKSVPPPL